VIPKSVTILGPQRLTPTLIEAVRSRGVTGRIATVTAGWQEREDEDRELHEHLEKRTVNLRLYHRAEAAFASDPDMQTAVRERQTRLQELQRLYRLRLHFALEAARELLETRGEASLVEVQRSAAIDAVRTLDVEHLAQVREIHAGYEEQLHVEERPSLTAPRRELRALLDDAQAVAIAGGHVAVLLNRLRLFGLETLLAGKHLFVWSAGAMACSERVVLFHDSPPQGAGDAEVFEVGLGLFPGLVPLPHAKQRLRLADRDRVALFARRFAPALCVALDPGTRVDWDGRTWTGPRPTRRMTEEGSVEELAATAGGRR
jgi:peptidase E